MVIGLVGHDVSDGGRYSYSTVKVPSYGQLITGASLLGIAFQGWLLLLLFWALQWDRATRPGYTPPAPLSPMQEAVPNRVQRDIAAQQAAAKVQRLEWSEES